MSTKDLIWNVGVSISDFSHPYRYIVVSHHFKLQLHKNIWCWAPFYMLICHVYMFFGEGLFRSFTRFWIGLFHFLIESFKSYLQILDNSPLSVILCKYFLSVSDLSCHSLNVFIFFTYLLASPLHFKFVSLLS